MQETMAAPARRAQPSPSGDANVGQPERVASAVAGGALALYGLRRRPARLPALLAGGYLLYRGLSGTCPLYSALGISTDSPAAARPSHVEHTLTIGAEPAELYALWRDFRNLPRFMDHLKQVEVLDERRSRWVARAPAGAEVTWDAEIFMERPDELILWRSLPGAQVANAGSVRFTPAPAGRGTEVRVVLEYIPPAGALGRAVARIFGEEPGQQVADDLHRLKRLIESGEVAAS